MEPSRDKDCGGGDDGEPENPRTVGEKEACYESLKRAAGTSALSLAWYRFEMLYANATFVLQRN
jgi:hypothetical protein